jgi:hypothetical protein
MEKFVDELVKESSNFPSFLSLQDVILRQSWKMTVFKKPNVPGKEDKVECLENTLKPFGKTDQLPGGTVITPTRQIPIAGTTNDDDTRTAIINFIKCCPTDTFCDLISFDYERNKQVDRCLVFRSAPSQPIRIIPVQTTIAATMDITKARKWVSLFRKSLKTSFSTNTPVVTAFCVLVPSISSTTINSSSVIRNAPFVVTEFDPHLDSTCASRYIRAMKAFYKDAINIARNNGKVPDYSKSYYPSTVPIAIKKRKRDDVTSVTKKHKGKDGVARPASQMTIGVDYSDLRDKNGSSNGNRGGRGGLGYYKRTGVIVPSGNNKIVSFD